MMIASKSQEKATFFNMPAKHLAYCMSPKKLFQHSCQAFGLLFVPLLNIVDNLFSRVFARISWYCDPKNVKDLIGGLWPFKLFKEPFEREIERLKEEKEFLDNRFYRADVVFDPETAHPRLEVSEDGKCVKDTGKVSNVTKSEKRFDSHMFILAKDGFSKGRHYWEVKVGQKKSWVLGVVFETICRKGKIALSPQNGSWVIAFEDGKNYWARTEPWTNLSVSGKPTKIGIFLNMSDRSLCFYDVSRKSKLHTFLISDSFSGKFYPFFSNGFIIAEPDSNPLRILPWFEEIVENE